MMTDRPIYWLSVGSARSRWDRNQRNRGHTTDPATRKFSVNGTISAGANSGSGTRRSLIGELLGIWRCQCSDAAEGFEEGRYDWFGTGSQFGGGVVDTYEGDYASALAEALEMLDEIRPRRITPLPRRQD